MNKSYETFYAKNYILKEPITILNVILIIILIFYMIYDGHPNQKGYFFYINVY